MTQLPAPPQGLSVRLVGLMSLTRSDGAPVEIKGLRARGLLALLLLSPDMTRSRRWLEGVLWSTRDAQQAGASLRQVLREIRKALAPFDDILIADRTQVQLVRNRISVDLLDDVPNAQAALRAGQDLFEGLAIKDDAFTGWLARTRQYYALPREDVAHEGPAVSRGDHTRPHIVLALDNKGSHAERALAQAMGRQIAQSAAETCPIEIASDTAAAARLYSGSVLVTPVVVDGASEAMVSLEISQPAQGSMIWSDRIVTSVGGVSLLNDAGLIGLANVASEQVTRHFARCAAHNRPEELARAGNDQGASRDVIASHALIDAAVTELFSFDVTRMAQAEVLLMQADHDSAGPLIDAWSALLCAVRLVEREAEDPQTMRERAEHHLRASLKGRGADNPTVLSIISQVISFLKLDDFDAFHFAERAVRMNPWNPMAKLALGLAEMRRGRLREGYRTCAEARTFAAGLEHRHWWDMSFSLAALSLGKTDEAIEAAERALSFHPQFRPPMRHLYALYLHAGHYAKAGRMLARMRAFEPEFSLRMMREDPDYPMVTIRRTPLGALPDMRP